MTDIVQRWRERRDSYRPAGEPIDTTRYGVDVVPERVARAFVQAHHYSGSFPAARLSVGLFRTRKAAAPDLVGVAVFSVGIVHDRSIGRWCGLPGAEGVELGRFVLVDDVEANGETWFLRRSFDAMRAELPSVRAVLAYSDPVPREADGGRLVMPGHVGTIYQAHNGRYLGRGRGRALVLAPDGSVVSERALSKIRNDERGQDYAARSLIRLGAPPPLDSEDGRGWVARALREGPFRRLRHPGNHVYAWPLDGRSGRDFAPTASQRPKVADRHIVPVKIVPDRCESNQSG